jgi:hypothetical protein
MTRRRRKRLVFQQWTGRGTARDAAIVRWGIYSALDGNCPDRREASLEGNDQPLTWFSALNSSVCTDAQRLLAPGVIAVMLRSLRCVIWGKLGVPPHIVLLAHPT